MPLPPNSDGRRRATLAACLAVACASILHWRRFHAAPPQRGLLFPSDFFNYYLPRGDGVAQRLARGELPLWNPRLCGGIPGREGHQQDWKGTSQVDHGSRSITRR